jgi:protein-S-isoprenylcysteine O-methyltransferase Ste14
MSRIPPLGPRGEGWFALQIAAIALVVVSAGRGRGSVTDPAVALALETIGRALVLLGLLVLITGIAVLRLAGAFTVFPRPVAAGQLVESGPYRLVRHPVYSGLVLAAVGSALTRPSLMTLLAAALLFVILDLKRRREEEWLLARYAGYAAYRTRTKALIPWVY